jgi:hypothetical protein
MYKLLITLMLLSALKQFGISWSEFSNCHTRQCIQNVERRSLDVLNIDWKPISVWSREAKRFK